jgi:uncharacterized membrane protein
LLWLGASGLAALVGYSAWQEQANLTLRHSGLGAAVCAVVCALLATGAVLILKHLSK